MHTHLSAEPGNVQILHNAYAALSCVSVWAGLRTLEKQRPPVVALPYSFFWSLCGLQINLLMEVSEWCAGISQCSTASKSMWPTNLKFETPSLFLRLSIAEGHEHHQASFELMIFFHGWIMYKLSSYCHQQSVLFCNEICISFIFEKCKVHSFCR